MPGKKILLIDGHGIAFRAFFAVPMLNAPDGTPTNVLVGFFNMFARARHIWKPDEVFCAFDMKGPTFRHQLYPDYKSTRKPTPDEFKVQIPLLHEMLPLLGVRLMERETVEADDLIGSAACQFAARGDEALILTSDKDIMQVLRPGVKILRPGKGVSSFDEYDETVFSEKYGFPPSGMVDYLALMGDAVDNIKGIPGVGEKTAASLLHDYGSIENIIAHTDELKPALRKKISEHGQTALDNRVLTRLKCDEDLNEFTASAPTVDLEAFARKCAALGMKKVAETFGASLPSRRDDVQPLSLDEDAAPNDSLNEPIPVISPAGAISLDAILLAPRLALDFDETKFVRSFSPDPALFTALGVVLAAPDGSWWIA